MLLARNFAGLLMTTIVGHIQNFKSNGQHNLDLQPIVFKQWKTIGNSGEQ